MADIPISDLPAAAAITSASLVPTVNSGVTEKATCDQLLDGLPDSTTGSRGVMTAAQATLLANATASNTVSTIVKRDNNGDFAARNITAAIVTGLSTPTNATDAANKAYVDSAAAGLTVKTPARGATTGANITLAGGAPTTLDGLTLVANDRILVKDQTDPKENGIYFVATLGSGSNGTWTRTTDADTGAELVQGTYIFITAGTTNGGSSWVMTTPDPVVIGSSNIIWFLYNQITNVPASAITGQIITSQIANLAITTAQFAASITPVEIVASLPVTGNFAGRTVYLTSDAQLYRYNGSAFTKAVPATDITGTITSTQIADNSISTPKLQANSVAAGNIQTNAITAGKIAANAVTAGTIAAGAVSTTELAVGGVTGTRIANGTIATANIAAGAIVASLINVSQLTAISADMGTITAGSLTAAASVSVSSGSSAVLINSSGLTIAGGKVSLAGDGTNPWIKVSGGGAYSSTGVQMLGRADGLLPPQISSFGGSGGFTLSALAVAVGNIPIVFNGTAQMQKGTDDGWTPPMYDGSNTIEFKWDTGLKVRIDGSTVLNITTTP